MEANGCFCFDVKSMTAGGGLASQLNDAIAQCEICVFLATKSAVESKWCLAELGAFWGTGKPVVIFVIDPDLTDESLPPQFKGNLTAWTLEALFNSIENLRLAGAGHQPQYFESSSDFGTDNDWGRILKGTTQSFDIMGITLSGWRNTNRFAELVTEQVAKQCSIRILLMHPDNPAISPETFGTMDRSISDIKSQIDANLQFFKSISTAANFEVRQIRIGYPHFFLTRVDQQAIMVTYANSQSWGFGPLWKTGKDSKLYLTLSQEFEVLWSNNA